jgi:hypothetical protein
MAGECHGMASRRKAEEAKRHGQGTCTRAEQVLALESFSGRTERGGMIGGFHSSVVQKGERVIWAS